MYNETLDVISSSQNFLFVK